MVAVAPRFPACLYSHSIPLWSQTLRLDSRTGLSEYPTPLVSVSSGWWTYGPKSQVRPVTDLPRDGRAWDELVEKVFLSLVCDVRCPLGALSCCGGSLCAKEEPRATPNRNEGWREACQAQALVLGPKVPEVAGSMQPGASCL